MRRCGCCDSRLTNGYLTVPLIIKDPGVTVRRPGFFRMDGGVAAKQNALQGFVFFFFPEYKKQRGKTKNSEQRLYPPNVISGLSWLLTGSR